MEGDVVSIGPSGWSTLANYPLMLQEWNSVAHDAHWLLCVQDVHPLNAPFDFEYNREGVAQHASFPLFNKSIIRRSQLLQLLVNQCKRIGIPIYYGVSITSHEENDVLNTATAISDDYRRFSGDVVIAADGMETKSHAAVLGYSSKS